MENQGWIKLHRKLNNTAFKHKPLIVALFIDLLTNANHRERKIIWNKREMVIEVGQLITGLHKLSKRTGISVQSLRTALTTLKSTNTITIKSTTKFSVITILNWNDYQLSTSELTNNQQTTNKQLTTNNNVENVKNDNKETHISYLQDIPEEDIEYFIAKYKCEPSPLNQKADALHTYCKSKGKRYKNYKALLENAVRKDFGYRPFPSVKKEFEFDPLTKTAKIKSINI